MKLFESMNENKSKQKSIIIFQSVTGEVTATIP